MQSVSVDRVFGHRESNDTEDAKFEWAVGWRYGFVFGVATVLTGWGFDAWEQFAASFEMAGVKLWLAAIAIIPLTVLAGVLAAPAREFIFRRLAIWFILGGATGIVGLFVSFAGVSISAMIFDPAMRNVWIFPMTTGVIERLPFVALFGAVLGLLAGTFQRTAVNWAWDSVSSDNRFTREGWRSLLIALPIAVMLGTLYDGSLNAQLRAPYQLTHRFIQYGLTMPTNPDLNKMSNLQVIEYGAVAPWHDRFSIRYTHSLVAYNGDTLNEAIVDATFDNDFVWRCETTWSGSVLGRCNDPTQTYRDWMVQFLRDGAINCDECFVVIEPATAVWYTQHKDSIDALKGISMTHHAGGVVVMRAEIPNRSIECRFVGANPTVIRDCMSQ